MKLALRRGAAEGASTLDRLLSWVIKTRLVTRFPHAGIVIGDTLYHSTGRKGLHADKLDGADWVLIDIGGDDERALGLCSTSTGVPGMTGSACWLLLASRLVTQGACTAMSGATSQ
jgi:hypothetical protein